MIDSIDYPLASDGLSYIVVDDYQGYVPFVVAIPSSINNLETYKYYEFTYHLKGKGLINNFEQLNSYLISSLFNKYHGNPSSGTVYVELDIVETSKKGKIEFPVTEYIKINIQSHTFMRNYRISNFVVFFLISMF